MAGLPNPVTFEAIDRYATRHGFRGDAYFRFTELLMAMDETYIQHAAQTAQQSRKKGGARGR